ncbi:hypothetical protein DMI62_18505 [Escherichia coli]|nr:hypothetical protein [Escherichia coli]
MRKYYACFTDLFSSTYAKRLFHVKQIPCRTVQSTAPQPKAEPAKPKAPRATPVRILYQCRRISRQTVPRSGEVSGDSCRASNQDSPPSIPTARKRMQTNASKMKANAVLLHSCEVTSGTPVAIVRLYVSVLRLTSRRNEQFPVRATGVISLVL